VTLLRIGDLLQCRTPFYRQVDLVVEVDLLDNAFQASGRPAGTRHVSGVGQLLGSFSVYGLGLEHSQGSFLDTKNLYGETAKETYAVQVNLLLDLLTFPLPAIERTRYISSLLR
jgi:hypothetical protein